MKNIDHQIYVEMRNTICHSWFIKGEENTKMKKQNKITIIKLIVKVIKAIFRKKDD